MKKKTLMFLITVTLVIAAFVLAGPASAGKHHQGRAVFEADIVPLDGQPLDKGRVAIRNNGKFKVKIKGAEADSTYYVYVMFILPNSDEDFKYLGTLETDDEGEGKLYSNYDCINIDGFVRMPWIEIYLPENAPDEPDIFPPNEDPQYVSGFAPVLCDDPGGGVTADDVVLPGQGVLPSDGPL